jgi:hypothetical protein
MTDLPAQFEARHSEWVSGQLGQLGQVVRHDRDAGALALEHGTNRVAMVGRVGATREAVEDCWTGSAGILVSIDYSSGHSTIVAAWR